MTEASNTTPRQGRWAIYAANVVAIGMVTCFAITAIQLVQWILPTWDARGVAILCALAALEAIASFWLVKNLPSAQRQIGYYHASEWVIFIICLKIFSEMRAGPGSLFNNILLWPVDFPVHLFTSTFLLNIVLVFASWQLSTLFVKDLYLLGLDEAVRFDDRITTTPVRDLIMRRFLYTGMIVVFMAGVRLQTFSSEYSSVSNGSAPIVLLFFILGLTLVSLIRYASLQATWRQAEVQVPVQIPRRWIFFSGITLGLLALFAIWLPTNYGLGFFETMQALLRFLYALLGLIYALLMYSFSFIARLLSKEPTETQAPVNDTEPNFVQQLLDAEPKAAGSDLWRSLLFWGVLTILSIVALRQYIFFNRDLVEDLKRFTPLRWLASALKKLRFAIKSTNKTISTFVQNGIKSLRSLSTTTPGANDWDYVNMRRLNPRQKVIFYYLALVKRAGEAQIPRQDGQTPYEYARSLTSGLEEEQEGVRTITDSFIEARYSRHTIPSEKANQVRFSWERLRQILRRRRPSSEKDTSPQDD